MKKPIKTLLIFRNILFVLNKYKGNAYMSLKFVFYSIKLIHQHIWYGLLLMYTFQFLNGFNKYVLVSIKIDYPSFWPL